MEKGLICVVQSRMVLKNQLCCMVFQSQLCSNTPMLSGKAYKCCEGSVGFENDAAALAISGPLCEKEGALEIRCNRTL